MGVRLALRVISLTDACALFRLLAYGTADPSREEAANEPNEPRCRGLIEAKRKRRGREAYGSIDTHDRLRRTG